MAKKPTYEELEQKVKELEKEKFSSFIDVIVDGVTITDINGKIIHVNKALLEQLGYKKDELIGKTPASFISKKDLPKFAAHLQDVMSEKALPKAIEYTAKRKDGKEIPFSINLSFLYDTDGKPREAIAVSRDIAEQKQVKKALVESESKYRNIIESIEEAYFEVDIAGNLTFFNDSLCKMLGYKSDKLMGMNNRTFMGQETAKKVYQVFNNVYSRGEPANIFDWELILKDGSKIYIEGSVSLIRDSEGHRIGFRGIHRDITKRVRAEEALRESEEKYRLLVENANDAIFIAQDEAVKFPNPRAEELTGYSVEELAKKSFIELIHPEDRGMVLERHLKRLKEEDFPGTYPFRIISRAGQELWVKLSTVLISWEDRPATLNFIRDITEKKKVEIKLLQSQRMEAVATLAGGIAHQFNNALFAITGNIGLIEMDYPQDEGIIQYIQPMKDSAHRMGHLTNQLLAYAKGGKYSAKTISLSDFVEDALPLIQHTIKPSIRVETDLPHDILSVNIDITQMQTVLSAIIANSDEAITEKGRIRIIARNEEIGQEVVKIHPDFKPGTYVCLKVEDDGTGMDEETKSRIFEPFYSTKFTGRGLSMAAVYGIVNNHNGWISIDSEQGKGTEVIIYLPAVEAGKEEVEVTRPGLVKGTGTILVIEDKEAIMDLNRQLLERLGYRVLEARTGKEAVDLAGTFDGDIDLALLDIKLPDMGGERVYPLLMKARPDLKVIVCSGYSIDGPVQEVLDAGAQAFVQKSFSPGLFSEKLKEVLAKNRVVCKD